MARRIVTGQRPDGTSRFARIEELEEDFRGIGSHRIWAIDDLAATKLPYLGQAVPLGSSPSAAETPRALRCAAPHPESPGGFRISLQRMAPGEYAGNATPFMHWHDTVDLTWLLAGELSIRLDCGDEVALQPGDFVVQHGTNHAWISGGEGALLGVLMYGAERAAPHPPAATRLDPSSRWRPRKADTARWKVGRRGPLSPEPSLCELLAARPRRVITGQIKDGRSVLARVEESDEDARATSLMVGNGAITHRMWASDYFLPVRLPFVGAEAQLLSYPSAQETPDALRTSSPDPAVGGLRVSFVKVLPEPDGRFFGMHWRNTLDVLWLFAGELTIGLDDGSSVRLDPGDAAIHYGTNYSWSTGPSGAIVGLVLLGLEREPGGVSPPRQYRFDRTPASYSGDGLATALPEPRR
jgi:hypothetical protein